MLPRTLEPEAMDTADEARDYDAMDHSGPNAAFVDRLVSLGARGPGAMLDLGTGPGHIPLLVCDRIAGARVVAVDLSPHMLELARAKAAASPHGSRITFQVADAKRLPFADASFDAVFSNTILHHIPDPQPLLAEAVRVLRPGAGVLLIRDLFRPVTAARVDELVDLHTAGATPAQKQLFRQSLHAALTPDELRAMLRELRLQAFEVVIDTDRHMSVQRR